MGVKGRRVHMIEEMSDTIISFQRGLLQFDRVNNVCQKIPTLLEFLTF